MIKICDQISRILISKNTRFENREVCSYVDESCLKVESSISIKLAKKFKRRRIRNKKREEKGNSK